MIIFVETLKYFIMKVARSFFCTKEKKTYKRGDEYKGKRKDIPEGYFVQEEAKKQAKK